MIFRPWKLGDTEQIVLQSAQHYVYSLDFMKSDFTELSEQGFAKTIEHDGLILGLAGLVPQWENRAIVWAMLSADIGKHFAAFHKHVEAFLQNAPFRRIEATVDVGFEQGTRWMQLLGFEVEGYLKAYRPDGGDMLLYSRIKQ